VRTSNLSNNTKEAKLFYRYMDDILRDIKSKNVETKLREINQYHPNLKFSIEEKFFCFLFLFIP